MEENQNNIQIQYFQLYSADLLLYKNLLNEKQIVEVLEAISIFCLFGKTKEFENEYQQSFYNKLEQSAIKNKQKYNARVQNGKLGGRPKKNNENLNETKTKPLGYENENLNETKTKPNQNQYNIIKDNIIEKNIIKDKIKDKDKKEEIIEPEKRTYGEFANVFLDDKSYGKLLNIYGEDRLAEAIEIVSSYVQSTGKKYKDFYAVLGKHNWVYPKVMGNKSNKQKEEYNEVKYNEDGSVDPNSIGFKWSV